MAMPYDIDYLDGDTVNGFPKEYNGVFGDKFFTTDTIQLYELTECGAVDPYSWEWDAFDAEQKKRLTDKFVARYLYRDIGIVPPGRWEHEVVRKLNEIMPKYKPLYQRLKEGYTTLDTGSEYEKKRYVFSEFPQTALSGTTQDYATNGRTDERETVRNGDFLDIANKIRYDYADVDCMILDELECMFSCLLSVSMNGF